MRAMLVQLWTNEPYGFPLYNASKHSDRPPSELEMNMEVAAQRVAQGVDLWIPCTVGHTNRFNEYLRAELLKRREEGGSNIAIDGGGRERAAEAARKALQEGAQRVREIREEVDKGIGGLEAPIKRRASKTDQDTLAKMRDQLGLFD